jgi:hypothetical protein
MQSVTIDFVQHLTTLMVSAFSSLGAVAILAWWLSGRFRAVEEKARQAMSGHETLDQQRHEENLGRFQQIFVSLARMGNGGNGHGPPPSGRPRKNHSAARKGD